MRWRRSSSSCSEKCSFTVSSSCGLTPEGFGRNHFEVFLMDLFFALRGHGPEDRPAVKDALEQVGFAPREIELGFAVGAGRHGELHAAGPDSAIHLGDQ